MVRVHFHRPGPGGLPPAPASTRTSGVAKHHLYVAIMIDAILKKLLDYQADGKHLADFLIAPTRYREGLRDPKRTWVKAFSSPGILALVAYAIDLAISGDTEDLDKTQLQLGLTILAIQTFFATLIISAIYWLATRKRVETRILADVCITAWLLLFVCGSTLGGVGIFVFEKFSPPPAPSDGRLEHFFQNMGTYLLLIIVPILVTLAAVTYRFRQHLSAVFSWNAPSAYIFVFLWFICSAIVVALTPYEITDALANGLSSLKSLL